MAVIVNTIIIIFSSFTERNPGPTMSYRDIVGDPEEPYNPQFLITKKQV